MGPEAPLRWNEGVTDMKRTLLAGTAVLLAGLAGCTQHSETPAAAVVEKAVTVPTAKAERRDLSRELEVAAEFRPYQEVEVHAKVSGYLKSISVDVGDHLAAGQVIGVLEVPEYEEELAHAAATEKRSELDAERAASEVKRTESAYQMRKLSYDRLLAVSKARPNLVAQQEVDVAAAQARDAEGQWETAKASFAATRQQVNVSTATKARVRTMMSYLRVTAPFAGVVTKRYVDTGAMIQAGTASHTQTIPLVRISQVDRLRMVLPVPESAVAYVKRRGAVEVRVEALKRVFQGEVARMADRLDAATRAMEIQVDLANPGGVILPGMFGTALLTLENREDVVAVPVQAVAGHDTKPTVLVVNGQNVLEERAVTLGLETPEWAEITAGITEGEAVVVGNRSGLKAGKTVTPAGKGR